MLYMQMPSERNCYSVQYIKHSDHKNCTVCIVWLIPKDVVLLMIPMGHHSRRHFNFDWMPFLVVWSESTCFSSSHHCRCCFYTIDLCCFLRRAPHSLCPLHQPLRWHLTAPWASGMSIIPTRAFHEWVSKGLGLSNTMLVYKQFIRMYASD